MYRQHLERLRSVLGNYLKKVLREDFSVLEWNRNMSEDKADVLGNVRKPLGSSREEDNHNKKRKADRLEEKNVDEVL